MKLNTWSECDIFLINFLQNSSNGIVSEMDIDKIRTYLKEASEAVLSDCGYKAVQIFRSSLRDFIDSPKVSPFY